MEQLSGQDASFLYFETANAPMHIGSFALYDPSTAAEPLTACRAMLPDPRFDEDCLRASFEDLRTATLGPSLEAR